MLLVNVSDPVLIIQFVLVAFVELFVKLTTLEIEGEQNDVFDAMKEFTTLGFTVTNTSKSSLEEQFACIILTL